MSKLKAIFNKDSENYFKLLADDNTIMDLLSVLSALKITKGFADEGNRFNNTYEEWAGGHEYFSENGFSIHIIFEEKYVYLVINCNEEKRKTFIEKLIEKFPQ